MKNKQYHTVGTVLKSNRQVVERGNIDTPNNQIHDRSLFMVGTDTSINSGGLNQFYGNNTDYYNTDRRTQRILSIILIRQIIKD